MFHTAAFTGNQTNSGAGVYQTLAGVADSFITTNPNNRYILPPPGPGIPANWRVALGYVMGASINRARINNATLRAISLPSIHPVYASATVPTSVRLAMPLINGPMLPATDEFGIECDNAGAGAERQNGALWLHDGVFNRPSGPIFTVEFTASNTGAANVWTASILTFVQNLPVGRYAIVGMACMGVNLAFARVVYPYGGPRPGCLCQPGATVVAQNAIIPNEIFRAGALGSWGEFDSIAQPLLEVFPTVGAATTQLGYLDLVRVR